MARTKKTILGESQTINTSQRRNKKSNNRATRKSATTAKKTVEIPALTAVVVPTREILVAENVNVTVSVPKATVEIATLVPSNQVLRQRLFDAFSVLFFVFFEFFFENNNNARDLSAPLCCQIFYFRTKGKAKPAPEIAAVPSTTPAQTPLTTFSFAPAVGANHPVEAYVVGSFTDWTVAVPMRPVDGGRFEVGIALPAGHSFEYKFVVDGVWVHDASQPTVVSPISTVNNVIST